MPSLQAEVTGRYDHAGDANRLLYTPLPRALTARETRRYTVDYDGDGTALTAFLAKVLADPVSHELTTGEAPKFTGSSFILDYGMKGGALDLEKETILAHHRGDKAPPFTIQSLRINRRLYVFDAAKAAETQFLSDRFVRDIVNPAIHTWKITSGEEADALVASAVAAVVVPVVEEVTAEPVIPEIPAHAPEAEAPATEPEPVAAVTEEPAEAVLSAAPADFVEPAPVVETITTNEPAPEEPAPVGVVEGDVTEQTEIAAEQTDIATEPQVSSEAPSTAAGEDSGTAPEAEPPVTDTLSGPETAETTSAPSPGSPSDQVQS